MTDMPERIWIAAHDADDDCTMWELISENDASPGLGDTEYIRADLCRPEAQGWQPIETAPKDGTRCILFQSGRNVCMGEYVTKRWEWSIEGWKNTNGNFFNPTHWMPRPTPPAT